MGLSTGRGGGVQASINITPLVDVVLVLLIIFMVVTPKLRSAKVQLPVADARDAPGGRKAPPVTLVLLADRQLLWDGTPLPLTALRERVRACPGAALTLKADARLPLEAVRPVLESVQAGGAVGVRFAVEAPPKS